MNRQPGTTKEPSIWIPDATNVVRVDAVYRPAQCVEHRGNPLVEALPTYLQSDEPLKQFANYPLWTPAECRGTPAQRISAIRRIRTYHETLPWHHAVMKDIFRAIWGAYDHWNPLVNRVADTQSLYRSIQEGTMGARPLSPIEPSHASMIGLLGASGMGKSTVVQRALSFLPQVINHPRHGFRQLVWVHVQCPPNGDLHNLLLWLLRHIDNVMGTAHSNVLRSNAPYAERVRQVQNLLREFHVALLVLDEAHHIFQENTRTSYLNFITSISNFGKTSVMHVGLPSAMDAFLKNMYTARRTTDAGLRELEPCMSRKDWRCYVDGLMKYQWTPERATAKEIGLVLEQLSGRVPALSSRLFELTQVRVVSSRTAKKVTTQGLLDVSKNYFKPVQHVLAELREKEYTNMPDYDKALKSVIMKMEADIDRGTPAVRDSVASIMAERDVWMPIVRKAAQHLADLGEEIINLVPKLVSLIHSGLKIQPSVEALKESYLQSCLTAPMSAESSGDVEKSAATKMREERNLVRQHSSSQQRKVGGPR